MRVADTCWHPEGYCTAFFGTCCGGTCCGGNIRLAFACGSTLADGANGGFGRQTIRVFCWFYMDIRRLLHDKAKAALFIDGSHFLNLKV